MEPSVGWSHSVLWMGYISQNSPLVLGIADPIVLESTKLEKTYLYKEHAISANNFATNKINSTASLEHIGSDQTT